MDKGFKERSGLINGLTAGEGRSNGLINGLINGNINGNKITPPKRSENSKKDKLLVVWIVLMIIIVVVGAIAVSMAMVKSVDWSTVEKYKDVDLKMVNDEINITYFGLKQTDGSFNFYIKFKGDFSNPPYYVSYGYIFVDDDSIPTTGYYTGYIGADYLIKIVGKEKKVSTYFYKFSGESGDQWNWSEVGGAKLIFTENYEIEGSVNYEFSKNSKFMVMAQNGYEQDITPIVKLDTPALVTLQHPLYNNTLMITLVPIWGEPYVNSIHLFVTQGVTTSDFNGHLGLLNDSKRIYVKINPENVRNEAIDVHVDYIDSNSVVTIWGDSYRKFIGVPDGIVIDGVFDDWNGLANFAAAQSNNVNNSNIDITAYSFDERNGAFFYVGVKGSMLKGNIAPEIEKLKPTGAPGGGGGVKIVKRPYDYAKITFVTLNNGTHTVEIYGFNGKIMGILYDGKRVDFVKAAVGKDNILGALEVGIFKDYKIKSYSIEMTDWNGEVDAIKNISLQNGYSRDDSTVPEFNMAIIPMLIIIVAISILRKRKN